MAEWSVALSKKAGKVLRALEKNRQDKVYSNLRALVRWVCFQEKRNLDIKALKGKWAGKYRLRTGELRIIFSVLPEQQLIRVYALNFRGSVY